MMTFQRGIGTFVAIVLVFVLVSLLVGAEVGATATGLFIGGLAAKKAFHFYKDGDKPKALGLAVITLWMLFITTTVI